MTDIVGRATNCEQIGEDGMCKRFIRENAVFLENLKPK
jgi:hypothetical protein